MISGVNVAIVPNSSGPIGLQVAGGPLAGRSTLHHYKRQLLFWSPKDHVYNRRLDSAKIHQNRRRQRFAEAPVSLRVERNGSVSHGLHRFHALNMIGDCHMIGEETTFPACEIA